ncbi:unnamed protein product, partial [Ixodes hexagonus]
RTARALATVTTGTNEPAMPTEVPLTAKIAITIELTVAYAGLVVPAKIDPTPLAETMELMRSTGLMGPPTGGCAPATQRPSSTNNAGTLSALHRLSTASTAPWVSGR